MPSIRFWKEKRVAVHGSDEGMESTVRGSDEGWESTAHGSDEGMESDNLHTTALRYFHLDDRVDLLSQLHNADARPNDIHGLPVGGRGVRNSSNSFALRWWFFKL